MSKAKIIAGAGIITAGVALSGQPKSNAGLTPDNLKSAMPKEITVTTAPEEEKTSDAVQPVAAVKRTAEKVYHRFEQIPSLSDTEAALYDKNDYTYVINADQYQKSGNIELKRVLKDEVTKANALSLVYRSECQTYEPKKHEDQLAKYVIDLRIMSKTGITKGPSQMDDNAVKAFIKYLAASPDTRQYVMPLLKASQGSLENAVKDLERKFFDNNGKLRPMDERDAALQGKVYANLSLKSNAWQTIASPELKKFIRSEEARMSKKVGRTVTLSPTTKNYLCLTELFPNKELLVQKIEDYNLAFYQLGRPGKTKHVTAALARSMNLKDENGNLDATRIPPFAVAAAISSINWKGNGKEALKDAQNLRGKLSNAEPEQGHDILRSSVKNWVTGKSKRYGVDELSELNIITPTMIRQYEELELAGAKKLSAEYQKAVEIAESKTRIVARKQSLLDDKLPAPAAPKEQTALEKGKTLVLAAIDFVRGR